MNDTDIIIRVLPKNANEELRLFLTRFQGHDLCALRTFYNPRDGRDYLPGKSGINVRLAMVPAIIEGLKEALNEAKRRGLIDGGDSP